MLKVNTNFAYLVQWHKFSSLINLNFNKNYEMSTMNKSKNKLQNQLTCKRYVISAKFAVVPGEVSAPVGVTLTL